MRRFLRLLIAFIVIVLLYLVIKNVISPSGKVTLSGNFDPSIIRVYIDGKQATQKDLGVRTFAIHGKPGTHKVLVSGPNIKTVDSTISVKPLLGGSNTIAVEAGPLVKDIVSKYLVLNGGQSVGTIRQFGNEWIGVSLNDPSANYTVMHALHYDYLKGVWVDISPSTRLDTSQAIFKNAPPDLIIFLTDTVAD
jgi:hypothetical protein